MTTKEVTHHHVYHLLHCYLLEMAFPRQPTLWGYGPSVIGSAKHWVV